jgi:hypothetical protein
MSYELRVMSYEKEKLCRKKTLSQKSNLSS